MGILLHAIVRDRHESSTSALAVLVLLLAAAGAHVTVFDNSPAQLKQDQLVAEREALALRTVEGDAADLSMFADESFDLVFNPVSTVFMADVRAVWRECARVLRRGGVLLTGSMNPVHYIFDLYKADEGVLEVAHQIPYSDLTSIPKEDLDELIEKGLPVEFGHSLTDLLGGHGAPECSMRENAIRVSRKTRSDDRAKRDYLVR